MGKSVTYGTLVSDLRFVLDLADSEDVGNDRLSAAQAERLINRSRDRLFGILAEEYGDDYFTYCVGVEVLNSVNPRQSFALPAFSTTAGVPYWKYPLVNTGDEDAWSPNDGGGIEDGQDAPAFHRLRKVQILETYDAVADSGTNLDPILTWSGRPRDMARCSLDGLNENAEARDWTTSDPPEYRLLGDQLLWFNRPATNNAGFLIWYVGNPLNVSGLNHTLMGPGWAEWLVLDAAIWFAMRDRDGVSSLSQMTSERARVEASIRAQAGGRDESSPNRVRRRYRESYDLGPSGEDIYDLNSYSRFR